MKSPLRVSNRGIHQTNRSSGVLQTTQDCSSSHVLLEGIKKWFEVVITLLKPNVPDITHILVDWSQLRCNILGPMRWLNE